MPLAIEERSQAESAPSRCSFNLNSSLKGV